MDELRNQASASSNFQYQSENWSSKSAGVVCAGGIGMHLLPASFSVKGGNKAAG